MTTSPSPEPKPKFNRQRWLLELLMENFPGSKVVDNITLEPIANHPLNKTTPPPPKRKRRRKGEAKVHKDQGGLF